jgi:hypothetical protein
MKTKLALIGASVILLPSGIGAQSQPAQTAPAQGATQTQGAANGQQPATSEKTAAQSDPACDSGSKSATADTKTAHQSAKVGKDTGDLPPPPKKKVSKDTACASQPQ